MEKVILCILDGVGIRKEKKGNCLKMASMPNFNMLMSKFPNSLLQASGEDVGLPKNQMGNSEVGHTNIGAGRIVYQPLEIINRAFKDKSIYKNEKLLSIIKSDKKKSKLHICGLLSDGGVHSDIKHLFKLLDFLKEQEVKNVYLHLFMDGRDTKVDSGIEYIKQLEDKLNELGIGKIASIGGRFYGMDRDNRYERIEQAYNVMVRGKGKPKKDYKKEIELSYEKGIYDEFIEPFLVDKKGLIRNNDRILTFNFRPDRLREIFYAITNDTFKEFKRKKLRNIKLLTMFPISDDAIHENIFEKPKLDNTLGAYLESINKTQLRIAETEKYAHVTYFFDGGMNQDFLGKDEILIPSPKVKTYDMKPEMSAREITDRLTEEVEKKQYDLVVLNFANGDMVGHTGNIDATVEALEVLDSCIGGLYVLSMKQNYTLVITADHGNCEYMLDEDNDTVTSHSKNPVPFIITDEQYKLKDGRLCDIAPTILKIMGLDIPKEMTGNVLISKKKIDKK